MYEDINIKELLDTYNINYTPSGKGYKMYCPFHSEKEPSFFVDREIKYWHCFGCGQSGNGASFYELITGQKYKYSFNNLWTYNYGKNKKNDKKEEVDKSIEIEKKRIKVFGKLQNPLKNDDIRLWLKKYGVEKDSFIRDYEITYSPYTEMIEESLMKDTSIKYIKMIDRIMSPIYSINNNLIDYEGRTYVQDANKVLYVRGGSTETLYNWKNINKKETVIVCEGIKGFWRLWNVYPNVLAMLHNIPTDYQFELLNSIEGELIFFLDNDAGGFGLYDKKRKIERKGTIQYLEEKLKKDFKICYSPIKGYDPNNCTSEQIEKIVNKAIWYTQYKINNIFPEKRSNEEW